MGKGHPFIYRALWNWDLQLSHSQIIPFCPQLHRKDYSWKGLVCVRGATHLRSWGWAQEVHLEWGCGTVASFTHTTSPSSQISNYSVKILWLRLPMHHASFAKWLSPTHSCSTEADFCHIPPAPPFLPTNAQHSEVPVFSHIPESDAAFPARHSPWSLYHLFSSDLNEPNLAGPWSLWALFWRWVEETPPKYS